MAVRARRGPRCAQRSAFRWAAAGRAATSGAPPRPRDVAWPCSDAPSRTVAAHRDRGGLAGTRIGLTGAPVLIGRANDSTLVLTDDYASTRHARISLQDGVWFVEDLGSTNGTYLGQRKVDSPMPLEIGVPVRIGKTVLELR